MTRIIHCRRLQRHKDHPACGALALVAFASTSDWSLQSARMYKRQVSDVNLSPNSTCMTLVTRERFLLVYLYRKLPFPSSLPVYGGRGNWPIVAAINHKFGTIAQPFCQHRTCGLSGSTFLPFIMVLKRDETLGGGKGRDDANERRLAAIEKKLQQLGFMTGRVLQALKDTS